MVSVTFVTILMATFLSGFHVYATSIPHCCDRPSVGLKNKPFIPLFCLHVLIDVTCVYRSVLLLYGSYAVCTCRFPPAIVSRVGTQSMTCTKPGHVMFVADRPGALRTV